MKSMSTIKASAKATYLVLCREKGISRVTVSDLTERANMARSTFYLHYDNLNSLLYEIENELLNDLKMLSISHIYPDGADKYLWLHSSISSQLCKTKENLEWYSLLLGSRGNPSFSRKVYHHIRTEASKKYKSMNVEINDIELDHICSGGLGMFLHWIRTNAALKPDRLAHLMIPPFHDTSNL